MEFECDLCKSCLSGLGLAHYQKGKVKFLNFQGIIMNKQKEDSLELRVLKRMIASKESYSHEDIINLIAQEVYVDWQFLDEVSFIRGFERGYKYKAKSLKKFEEDIND